MGILYEKIRERENEKEKKTFFMGDSKTKRQMSNELKATIKRLIDDNLQTNEQPSIDPKKEAKKRGKTRKKKTQTKRKEKPEKENTNKKQKKIKNTKKNLLTGEEKQPPLLWLDVLKFFRRRTTKLIWETIQSPCKKIRPYTRLPKSGSDKKG